MDSRSIHIRVSTKIVIFYTQSSHHLWMLSSDLCQWCRELICNVSKCQCLICTQRGLVACKSNDRSKLIVNQSVISSTSIPSHPCVTIPYHISYYQLGLCSSFSLSSKPCSRNTFRFGNDTLHCLSVLLGTSLNKLCRLFVFEHSTTPLRHRPTPLFRPSICVFWFWSRYRCH